MYKFKWFYSAATFVQGMSDFPRAWHKTEQLIGTLRQAHCLFLQPVLELQNTSLITLSLRAGWSDIIGTIACCLQIGRILKSTQLIALPEKEHGHCAIYRPEIGILRYGT